MPAATANPINNLFQAPQRNPYQPQIVEKGSVIGFHYVGQTTHRINDPYPLVIVSDIWDDTIRGVNLHYLTLPTVRDVLKTYGGFKQFSYANVKQPAYIGGQTGVNLVRAFRSYKRAGITNLKMLDVQFLQQVLSVVRALDPGEIEAMRAQIRQMMQRYPVQQQTVPPNQATPQVPTPDVAANANIQAQGV